MSEKMKFYNMCAEVPAEAKKEIGGGRLKGMTDINPMWRIKKLTEMFGACGFGWYTEVIDKRLERGCGDQISCFVEINLYVKDGDTWSKPIHGMGGSAFVVKESSGLYQSDECFKMAYTDAISVACKALGMASSVYFAKDRSKYDQQTDASQTQTAQVRAPKPVTTQTQTGNETAGDIMVMRAELMHQACLGANASTATEEGKVLVKAYMKKHWGMESIAKADEICIRDLHKKVCGK